MGMTPRLRHNIVANAAGRFSSIALAILMTPVYLALLGIEAYGLIVFYITLQSSSAVLELGLGRACNRELAYQSQQGDAGRQAMRDTLRSLEGIYWLIALMLGVALTTASSWIAREWLKSSAYSGPYLAEVLVLAGWAIALRWPAGVYAGAMLGLQRHAAQSTAQVLMAALSWLGGAAVLWLYGPDLRAFFLWQAFASLCAVVSFRLLAWRVMPSTGRPGRFSIARLKGLAPFVAGVGGNAFLGAILTQADKLILSAVLPLDQFGYYALASMIATAVMAMAEPVSTAVFPRFSQMLGSGQEVTNLYRLACQAVSVLVMPVSLVILFFPREVIHAYTGKADVAESAATALSVLVLARMLHAGMLIPYALQMAHGSVRQTVCLNVLLALWLVPGVYFLGAAYGPTGAAAAWLVLGAAYVLIGVPLMHRSLLAGEGGRWAWQAMAVPLAAVSAFLLFLSSLVAYRPEGRIAQVAFLAFVWCGATMVAVLSTPRVRGMALQFLGRRSGT